MSINLFQSWGGVLHVLIIGTLAYAGLVALLRVSGKRTLSKMNAFDFVVTVALGSALASTMLTKSLPLAEGLSGLALLILLQYAVTWASVRSERVQGFVKAQPALIVHRGQWQSQAMLRERVTKEEVLAALRSQGKTALDATITVVIETDGSLSVLSGDPAASERSSLANVEPLARWGG